MAPSHLVRPDKELPIIAPFRIETAGVTATDQRSLPLRREEQRYQRWLDTQNAMIESVNEEGADYKLCIERNTEYRQAFKIALALDPNTTVKEFNRQWRQAGHDDFTDETLQVLRFELRHDSNRRFDGGMVWTNSRIVDRNENQVTLRAQCIVSFYDRPQRSYFQLWGRTMRELMEKTDITLIGGRNLEILGFNFPRSTRFVAHVNAPGKTNMTDFEDELLGGVHTITRETTGEFAGRAPATVLKINVDIPPEV